MHDIMLISPEDFMATGDSGTFPVFDYELHFLAQGDSWFSIGAIPPWKTSNLFDKLCLSKRAFAVNCAAPGAELVHMVDTTSNRTFIKLLNGKQAIRWTALLLSGLGNDVISAAQSPPSAAVAKRLLAKKSEWKASGDASRYISEAGWATFDAYARGAFQQLLSLRDETPINRGLPIVVHTYDFMVPRNAPAGAGFGPWLYKAVRAFRIPEEDWAAVATELVRRTGKLIHSIASAESTVQVIETQGTLQPAPLGQGSPSEHWCNEIHPTRTGYRLLGDIWERSLERLYCVG